MRHARGLERTQWNVYRQVCHMRCRRIRQVHDEGAGERRMHAHVRHAVPKLRSALMDTSISVECLNCGLEVDVDCEPVRVLAYSSAPDFPDPIPGAPCPKCNLPHDQDVGASFCSRCLDLAGEPVRVEKGATLCEDCASE